MGSSEPAPFVRLDTRNVWSGHRISVERQRYRSPDGEVFEREFTQHPGAVGIIAVSEDRMVTLVRQFRVPMGDWIVEMPAGTCDVPGEDPERTAQRELAEEVGIYASDWELLAPLPVSPGVTNQITRVYLATGLSRCETDPEGPEERAMTVFEVPIDDVFSTSRAGVPIDASTIAGVALARAALDQRR